MLEKETVFITFKAVDYKAHVFINGTYIGSHEGAFAPFEFDVSQNVIEAGNSLLIKVDNNYRMPGNVGDDGKKLDGDKVYAVTGLGYEDPVLGWPTPADFYSFKKVNVTNDFIHKFKSAKYFAKSF